MNRKIKKSRSGIYCGGTEDALREAKSQIGYQVESEYDFIGNKRH